MPETRKHGRQENTSVRWLGISTLLPSRGSRMRSRERGSEPKWWRRAGAVCVLSAVAALAANAQTFTSVFSFDGTDGELPEAGLVQATNGNFYGTTAYGGANSDGTVFKITPTGSSTPICPRRNQCITHPAGPPAGFSLRMHGPKIPRRRPSAYRQSPPCFNGGRPSPCLGEEQLVLLPPRLTFHELAPFVNGDMLYGPRRHFEMIACVPEFARTNERTLFHQIDEIPRCRGWRCSRDRRVLARAHPSLEAFRAFPEHACQRPVLPFVNPSIQMLEEFGFVDQELGQSKCAPLRFNRHTCEPREPVGDLVSSVRRLECIVVAFPACQNGRGQSAEHRLA